MGGTPLTLPSIAVMEVWWGLGYHTIFFLAGLASLALPGTSPFVSEFLVLIGTSHPVVEQLIKEHKWESYRLGGFCS